MSIHPLFARSVLAAAAGSLALAAGAAAPLAATAQSQPYYGPNGEPSYQAYHDCERDRTGRTIFGALIGAAIGGVLGSNIAAGGHRGDGTAVGAGVGAVGGGIVGNSTANCGGGPPPGQAYYDNGAYRSGYNDRDGRYGSPPPPPGPAYSDNDGRYGPPPAPRYDDGRYAAPPPGDDQG
ncbi:MAG TPA: glycine zipper 2TM domain-containing protein, partial [Caulobacteraceae bacterium]|nr:glycine zipper 2TM domain-containing protein [Caulobacteraceae bacterium]